MRTLRTASILAAVSAVFAFGLPAVAQTPGTKPTGAGVQYTCQSATPGPSGTERSWVRCSDSHLIQTNAANASQDISAAAGGGGSGTVQSVDTGAGLSGGVITTSGTIDLRLNVSGGLVKNLGVGVNELGIGAAAVTNAMLANPSLTISATSPLGGGGSVSLGGSLTLTCTTCVVTTGSYADPSWITALAGSKITGTVASATSATTAGTATNFSGSLSGDVSGGQTSTSVNKLKGVAVSATAPTNTQVLQYVLANTDWEPATVGVTVNTTSPLTGGGSVSLGGTITVACSACLTGLPNVGPGAGTYTFATSDSVTLDAQGRVSAISNVTRTISAGTGLTGGGTLAADRSFSVDQSFSPIWTGTHTFSLTPVIGDNTGTTKSVQFDNLTGLGTLSWNPSALRTLTLPDATDTLVGQATTDTLTNKTISGASNTLTNIGNASLSNSSITVNATAPLGGGATVPLGGFVTLTCSTCVTQAYVTVKNSSGIAQTQRNNLKFGSDFTVSDSTPDTVVALATNSLTVAAGTGLSGGGSVALGGTTTLSLPNVGPGVGTIGGSGIASITLDAQGRVTAAATATYLTAASAFYQTIQSSGVGVTQRGTLNFAAGLIATDDSINGRTNATVGGTADATYSTGAFTWAGASGKAMSLTSTASTITITAASASTWDTDNGTVKAATFDTTTGISLAIGGSTATSVALARSGTNVLLPGGTVRASTAATGVAAVSMLFGLANGAAASGATAATAGGATTVQGGQGGAALTTAAAAAGGLTSVLGGQGGTGAASVNGPANGGGVAITGGAGGTVTSGFGGANGGSVTIRGGALSGTGSNGAIVIGDLNTSSITAGSSTVNVSFTGGGTSALDFSTGSGVFKTSTGANQLSGNTTLSDTKTFTASYNGAGAAQQNTVSLSNSTAATSSVMQWSPFEERVGHGWTYRAGVTSNAGSATRSGTLVTVTTTVAHGLSPGNSVYVNSGADSGTIPVGSYTLVSASGSTLTFNTVGSGAFTSTVSWIIYDLTGQDQAVKVAVGIRPVAGVPVTTYNVDYGMSSPDLVYYRSSYPNNGSYGEWFKLSATDPLAFNTGFTTTAGVTMRTRNAAGNADGSYLKLAPGTVALSDDAGNYFFSVSSGNTIPNTNGYWNFYAPIVPQSGTYGTNGLLGFGLGTPTGYWYDTFSARGDFQNVGVGDIATPRWYDGGGSGGVNGVHDTAWFSAQGNSYGPYGYYSLGGQTRFAAVPNPGAITVSVQGVTGSTSRSYSVVAVDRNGYTTIAGTGNTTTGNNTFTSSNFDRLTVGSVIGAVRYDWYLGTVSQVNWLASTTSPTYDYKGSVNFVATPSMLTGLWSAQGGGSGVSRTYAVYAVDSGGRLWASGTASASFGAAPSLTNYWQIAWTPIGGATAYIITRDDLSHPIFVQTQSGVQQATGTPTNGFVKTNTSNVVTVTISSGHGLKVGDSITISGLLNTTQFANGTYTVATVASATVFTYTDGVTNSSGSTQTTTGTFTGPFIITSSFLDYGYSERLIGSAARNTTADVNVDGFVSYTGSTTALPTAASTAFTAVSSFANSWTSNSGPVGYFKDAMGFVHLRGVMSGGTINTTAFTLPAGYRPATFAAFSCFSFTGSAPTSGFLAIDTAGVVTPQVGSNNQFYLEGVTFYAGN